MATTGQMTGMLGTYLAAAEVTHKGLIVSITSRNAKGADLLITDQAYKKTWSIQVENKSKGGWILVDGRRLQGNGVTQSYLHIHKSAW